MAISKETYKKAYDQISKSDRILICLNNRSTLDTYLAAAATYLYIKDRGKKVSLCVDKSLKTRPEKIFGEYSIKYDKKLKPLRYSITIDHKDGDIDSVRYDDKDGKFSLYITPQKISNGFDFKNIEFKEGGKYDLVIAFGAEEIDSLGSLYLENEDFFNEIDILNINNLVSKGFGKVSLTGKDIPVCEIVFNLIKDGFSSSSVNKIVKLLLMGILNELQLFNKSDYKISTIEAMTSLVKLGADLKDSFDEIYFNLDPKMVEIVREVLKNMEEDEKYGIAWSKVDNLRFKKHEVNRDNFVLDGYISFNLTDKYDIAFVIYEVGEGEVWIELESNSGDLSAKEILSQFTPSGHDYRALAIVKDLNVDKVEDVVLGFIKGYIDGRKHRDIEADSKNILTNADKTRHNDSVSKEEGLISPPPLTPST